MDHLAHGVQVEDQELRAEAEPNADQSIWNDSQGRDGDFHPADTILLRPP